jgi:hypothetical protein
MSQMVKPGYYIVDKERWGWIIPPEEARRLTEARERRNEYRRQHAVCPKCSSDDVLRTLMGVGDSAVDDNRARCQSCHWVGIVHDLVPRKEIV